MTSLKARWQNRYIIENMPPSLHAGEEEAEANEKVLTMGLEAREKQRLLAYPHPVGTFICGQACPLLLVLTPHLPERQNHPCPTSKQLALHVLPWRQGPSKLGLW